MQAVPEIDAAALAKRLNEPDPPVLLDVREAEELAIARLAGALHIPMGDVPSRQQELDPERELVVFCHHGMRSLSVAAWLQQNDYPKVINLRGGIDAWSREVDERVPRY